MEERKVIRKSLRSLHLRPAFGMDKKTKDLFLTGGIDLYIDYKGESETFYCMLTHNTVQQLIDAITHTKKLPGLKPITVPSSAQLQSLVYTIDQESVDIVDQPDLEFINNSSQFGDYLKETLNGLNIAIKDSENESETE